MYYNQDSYKWEPQIDQPTFNQQKSHPPGSEVVMSKVRTRMFVPMSVAVENGYNFDVRRKWDTVLYDLKVFEDTADKSYMRYAYSFKSPFPVSHRDFYLQQLVRWDFPEKGMMTLAAHSLPDCDEYPAGQGGKVRGQLTISMIFKPAVDPKTNKECVDVMMTNLCDINGLVPKWLVNSMSKNVPGMWFKLYESGCK